MISEKGPDRIKRILGEEADKVAAKVKAKEAKERADRIKKDKAKPGSQPTSSVK